MDGFEPNTGVVVLAATNRADVLDPALTRPGRFDRRIMLDLPDIAGRTAILKVHARSKQVEPGLQLERVARLTHGFSGADLANLLNEAAILAVRRGKDAVGLLEMEAAIDRVTAGPERPSLNIAAHDREITAYHEAGHALVAHLLPDVDKVHKISILSRGSIGGYTRLVSEDRFYHTARRLKNSLKVLLAGSAAEELVFNESTTGRYNDIQQATALARKMVMQYGMSETLGLRTFGDDGGSGTFPGKDFSEDTARLIDHEVKKLVDDAHGEALKLIDAHRISLDRLASKLILEETVDGQDLNLIFA